jgi:hypothetical protein
MEAPCWMNFDTTVACVGEQRCVWQRNERKRWAGVSGTEASENSFLMWRQIVRKSILVLLVLATVLYLMMDVIHHHEARKQCDISFELTFLVQPHDWLARHAASGDFGCVPPPPPPVCLLPHGWLLAGWLAGCLCSDCWPVAMTSNWWCSLFDVGFY